MFSRGIRPNTGLSGGGQKTDLSLLSKFRSELMGFSILIIVFYHFCNRGGTTLIDRGFRFLFSQGYVGVDIFLVVSGLGLTYSMLKDENLKSYYLKRWVRIFPFFTFITIIECWIIRGEAFELVLLRSTTLGYWLGFPYIDWYIPALVGLYVIYPILFYAVVKPRRYIVALVIGLIFFIAGVVAAERALLDWKHLAIVYRIPDFLIGCMVAVAIKDGYENNRWTTRYILISAFIGVLIFLLDIGDNYCEWFVNLFLLPFYLFVLCWIFERLSLSRRGKNVVQAIAFVGLFTLELYRISSSFERLLIDEACPKYHFLFVLLYFVLSIILSYIAYLVFKHINDFLYRKLKIILKV